jgi:HAMP domain-containing protein
VRLRLTNQVRPLEALSSSLVDALDREVGDERSHIIANIGRAQRGILLIVPLTAAIVLVFAAFSGMVITRSISQPLSRLMEAAKALGRSEFHHRVSIAGRDELAHLGHIFNDTAATLRDLYQALFTREAYLAEAQRLSHTGSFGWNLSDGALVWSDEMFRIFACDRDVTPTIGLVLQRTHPDDVALVRQHIDRSVRRRDGVGSRASIADAGRFNQTRSRRGARRPRSDGEPHVLWRRHRPDGEQTCRGSPEQCARRARPRLAGDIAQRLDGVDRA